MIWMITIYDDDLTISEVQCIRSGWQRQTGMTMTIILMITTVIIMMTIFDDDYDDDSDNDYDDYN